MSTATHLKFTFCLASMVGVLFSTLANGQTFSNLSDTPAPQQPQIASVNDSPYVLILPGILGEQLWDRNLQKGILNAGLGGDVEIYDWTQGPLMAGFNIGGNSNKIDYLTNRIREFKRRHPSRPLYLVGHSGGCRMAIKVLENLPKNVRVEKSLLLSPCMEANYNLGPAMQACRSGLIAFRSPMDIPISLPLTTLHGLANGRLSLSASIVGFRVPETQTLRTANDYQRSFSQITYAPEMFSAGHTGGHFGWTHPNFAARYVAPLLTPTSIAMNVSENRHLR